MKSYSAAVYTFALLGGAAASSVSACATGGDTPPTTPGFVSTSSSNGGGSSGSDLDATTSSSSGSSSGSTGSSSGYGDDTTNPPPGDDAPTSTGDDAGDDGSGNLPPGPTCTPGQACVDGVPSGWNGFVQLLVASPDAGAAGCAAPYDTVQPALGGQTNPSGGPAGCGSCNCTLPDAGTSCSISVGTGNLGCTTGGPTSPATQGTCLPVPPLSNFSGQIAATPTVVSGQCQAGPIAVTTPPSAPTSSTAVACAGPSDAGASGGDAGAIGVMCSSGQACAAFPSTVDGGMPSGVCVYQAGIQTCPPSGTTLYTNTFVVGAVEDSRGCGCSCAPFACPTDGYVNGYGSNDCSGATDAVLDAGNACKLFGVSAKSVKYIASRSGSPGTCAVADAGPTGTVDIDGGSATTFCCIP